LNKNDTINAYIEKTGYDGEGIAKIDGYTVFVRGAAEGDYADIKILKVNKNFAYGKIEKITSPSPHRREALCPSFGKCGGCSMMHVNYEKQLEVKTNTVINNLRKIAHLNEGEYIFEGIIGCSEEYNYRNKAQYPLSAENGKAVLGFYAAASHRVIPCDSCKIQNELINKTANAIVDYINENNISIYDEKSGKGIVRHIYIRTSQNGDIMSVIVTNSKKEIPLKSKLIEKLTSIGGMKSIIQNINLRSDNVVMGSENITLWGDERITLSLGALKFLVSPNSFFQVNSIQTEKLYAKALEYADLSGDETVFDLYCGVGSISLYMAKHAKEVYGVEIIEAAIENAKSNALMNNADNAYFYAGDCTKIVGELINSGKKADVVVVDPPRKGCDINLLHLINKISPNKLVYVSCNSATLARDISYLSEFGYKFKKATAVDMFPQTSHVECCALLTKE